jgi:hypothetical protein
MNRKKKRNKEILHTDLKSGIISLERKSHSAESVAETLDELSRLLPRDQKRMVQRAKEIVLQEAQNSL